MEAQQWSGYAPIARTHATSRIDALKGLLLGNLRRELIASPGRRLVRCKPGKIATAPSKPADSISKPAGRAEQVSGGGCVGIPEETGIVRSSKRKVGAKG